MKEGSGEESSTSWLTPQMPMTVGDGPGLSQKPETQPLRSYMDGRDPFTWAISCCLPGCILVGGCIRSRVACIQIRRLYACSYGGLKKGFVLSQRQVETGPRNDSNKVPKEMRVFSSFKSSSLPPANTMLDGVVLPCPFCLSPWPFSSGQERPS